MIERLIADPPTFESVEEERRDRKARLAAGFRILSGLGMDEGVGGHISARDPEWHDRFWVNPFGMNFALIRSSDLILVDASGAVVDGSFEINRAAFAIHSQIHAQRPDCVSAVHAHSIHGRAWSALGRKLDPITQNACVFFEDHGLFDDYTGPVLDLDEGKRIATALADTKGVILRNHGLLTVGRSVDEAVWWFIAMDRCCQIQLLAEAAGDPIPIDPDTAAATNRNNGNHKAGWLSFQPLYERVIREQRDIFE